MSEKEPIDVVEEGTLVPAAIEGNALVPISNGAEPSVFNGISVVPITSDEATKLLAPISNEHVDILPTGEVYVPHIHLRQRLNEVFGPGQWALRPLSTPQIRENEAVQSWALYIRGAFVAYTISGAQMIEANDRMTWADVLESLKSNAISRLCKDIGVGTDCWDKHFISDFKQRHCIKVWIDGQNRPRWRRVDADPFYKEKGCTDDSPNKPQMKKSPHPEPKRDPVIEAAEELGGVVVEEEAKKPPAPKEKIEGKVGKTALVREWGPIYATIKEQYGLDATEVQKQVWAPKFGKTDWLSQPTDTLMEAVRAWKEEKDA